MAGKRAKTLSPADDLHATLDRVEGLAPTPGRRYEPAPGPRVATSQMMLTLPTVVIAKLDQLVQHHHRRRSQLVTEYVEEAFERDLAQRGPVQPRKAK